MFTICTAMDITLSSTSECHHRTDTIKIVVMFVYALAWSTTSSGEREVTFNSAACPGAVSWPVR